MSRTHLLLKYKVVPEFNHHTMETYRGIDVKLHTFITSAIVGREWSGSSPGYYTQGTHWKKRLGGHQSCFVCGTKQNNP
jgi:hypothetical protein